MDPARWEGNAGNRGRLVRLEVAASTLLLAAERAARLEKERLARWAKARAQQRVDRAAQKIAARAAREERTAARLRLAASGETAKFLLKTEGVESGQIPDKVHRPFVEHTVFDVPGGDTTTSMPKSPALPVAAQPGLTLETLP